jgi:soluble lytic murein transglycosylase-like protein
MSRIVFANDLRKTITSDGIDKVPFYAKPKVIIPLVLINMILIVAFALSWKFDSVWSVFPQAKAYAIPNTQISGASDITVPGQDLPDEKHSLKAKTILDPKAQKAAEYIANNYRIAREAAELIAKEAYKSGKENDVDPLLILAVIGVESRFNPISESHVGALGLTQTMPEAHPEKIASIQRDQGHILNIADNIQIGSKIIGEYMRKFGNNSVLALQQYNGSLKDKSRVYSTKVLELRAKFAHAVG